MRTGGVVGAARQAADGAARSAFAPAAVPLWAAAVAIIGLPVAFVAFGGLAPATSQPLLVPAGSEARTSLYAVTVLDAEVTDEVEGQYLEAEPGETLLVVTVRLENLSDRAVGVEGTADRVASRLLSSSAPLLELSGVTATDTARSWRSDGSLRAVVLQPGVPAEVRIAWPVADDALAEHEPHLDVYDARAQSGQVILSSSAVTWRRTELVARTPVEVGP